MLGRCRVLAAVAAGVMWLVLCLSTLETSGTAVRGGIEPDQTGRPGPFDSRSPIALFYPYGKNG